jgi:hypothetical protein
MGKKVQIFDTDQDPGPGIFLDFGLLVGRKIGCIFWQGILRKMYRKRAMKKRKSKKG